MQYHSHNEIHNQDTSLKQTFDYVLANAKEIKNFFAPRGDIVFVGCGSSYWMSLSAHKTMKIKTGRRTYAVKAGDVVLCPEEFTGLYDNPVFFCPSRSGKTGEVLDAVDILKAAYPGSRVFVIDIYPGSALGRKADMSINIGWANEESVCQTRSFSNLYLASIAIAAILGGDENFIAECKKYLGAAPALYINHEKAIRRLIETSTIASVVALGGGLQYGVVIEGAYIVIEMAEFASNYYQLLEYRHGPIVTATPESLVFICSGISDEHEKKIALETKAVGAKVCAVTNGPVDWADYVFSLDGSHCKEILAMHFVFVMQSFAHHFSVARGKNPDSPGNLVPFILY